VVGSGPLVMSTGNSDENQRDAIARVSGRIIVLGLENRRKPTIHLDEQPAIGEARGEIAGSFWKRQGTRSQHGVGQAPIAA
jgi:hypothetical protein